MCPPIVAGDRRLFAADAHFAATTQSKMQDIVRICRSWGDGAGMRQGYTYLGQFLAHDIVSREVPHMPASTRTRKLDLDSVYGRGARLDERGRFLYTEASTLFTQDLLRDPVTRAACIPEFRNDLHPIIAQLHLTIQLFHNAVSSAIESRARHLGRVDVFEAAQRYVVATLQRIYVEDYLAKCSDPVIYGLYREGVLKVFELPASETQLPYEISHATMRFGHAQVRESYLLNASEVHTQVTEFFSLSGLLGGAEFKGLPKAKAVDWRRFFEWGSANRGIKCDSGRRINPKIGDAMGKIPEPPTENVVVRNIEAGIRVRLPSGQSIAKRLQAMNIDRRIQPELRVQPDDAKHEQALRDAGLWDETPLWLYVLIEASGLGGDGIRLGPLGSVFLCETIRSALEGQPDFRDVHAHFDRELGLPQIATFVDLVKFTDPQTYAAAPVHTDP